MKFINSIAKNKLAIFDEKIEIRERCKGVHCVDLGESFPTTIYLQKSASIQPRTSPSKFGGKYSILFNRVLTHFPASCTAGCVAGCPENCTLSARPCPHQHRMVRGPPITTEHHPHTMQNWPEHEEGSTQGNRIEGLKIERAGTDVHRHALGSGARHPLTPLRVRSNPALQARDGTTQSARMHTRWARRLPGEERTQYRFTRRRKKANRLKMIQRKT